MVTRADHRRETLLALSDAATSVFERHGSEATIDDVANEAGVSRRTVYRWVDGREDLVFIRARLWIEIFDEAVTSIASEPLTTRLEIGTTAVCTHIDDDPEPVARAMGVALEHPTLMRGYAAVNQAWIDRMTAEVMGTEPPTEDDAFRARILGAAIMGVIDAALSLWLVTSPRPKLGSLVHDGLELLDPILS